MKEGARCPLISGFVNFTLKGTTMFDASAFLNATFSDANSTEIKPAPAGEYVGVIEPLNEKSFSSGVSQKTGKPWARLDLYVKVEGDQRIKAATGLDAKAIKAGIMLDLTENGGIDFSEGRNVTLGRLRKATGLNTPGQPFSFQMFAGKPVKIQVTQRIDPVDASKVYNDVAAFTSPF